MKAQTLLIFRLGSIGDTVVALPSFRAIARAFPHEHRVLITNAPTSVRASPVESVLKGTGLIHETIYYPVGGEKLRNFSALLLTLRRRRAHTLIYLQPRPSAVSVLRDVLFFRAAGISRIIGAPWLKDLRQCRTDPCTREVEFETERLARTLQPRIHVELSAGEFDLQFSELETMTAAAHLQATSAGGMNNGAPPIAVAAGAKWVSKDWGESKWGALIEDLSSTLDLRSLVFLGAADERGLAERLAAKWVNSSLNLCGTLTPRETAAVLARCALLICHDSGPMHLAASQRTPCVALFGDNSLPHRWFPYGGGHQVIYEPTGVRNITVRRVAEAVADLLHAQARVAA